MKTFRARKVCTISELTDLLECSTATTRRRIKEWKTHTSYNNNGKYYALPDIINFDANGLWRFGATFFSRYGNLRQTLVGVVANSLAGLCAAELRELLGVEPRSFLSLFRNIPDLRREKHQGRFVYFAADEMIYREQRRRRLEMRQEPQTLSNAETISVLVETIKCPDLDIDQLLEHLQKRSFCPNVQAVRNLFATHDLKRKKTPLSRP